MKADTCELERLLATVQTATEAVKNELLRLHPIGSEVRFTITHGQRNASTGTVIGIGWRPDYLRVRHHEAKPRSRYAYREVHWQQVLRGAAS